MVDYGVSSSFGYVPFVCWKSYILSGVSGFGDIMENSPSTVIVPSATFSMIHRQTSSRIVFVCEVFPAAQFMTYSQIVAYSSLVMVTYTSAW